MDDTRLRLYDKALLALWVWMYALMLHVFGWIKRFEEPSAKS
jgi:hypothetical protein